MNWVLPSDRAGRDALPEGLRAGLIEHDCVVKGPHSRRMTDLPQAWLAKKERFTRQL